MPSQSTILLTLVALLTLGMIYIGFQNFVKSNEEAARDTLKEEIATLSHEALNHFQRPKHLGGGGGTFLNFKSVHRKKLKTKKSRPVPEGEKLWESEQGVYFVLVAARDSVVIEGTGDHIGYDGKKPIRVRGVLKAEEMYFTIIN